MARRTAVPDLPLRHHLELVADRGEQRSLNRNESRRWNRGLDDTALEACDLLLDALQLRHDRGAFRIPFLAKLTHDVARSFAM